MSNGECSGKLTGVANGHGGGGELTGVVVVS